MQGKIFYRQRTKVKEGSRTPRFRVVAVAGTKLKIFSNHLRRKELKQLASETGCELVELTRDSKKDKKKGNKK